MRHHRHGLAALLATDRGAEVIVHTGGAPLRGTLVPEITWYIMDDNDVLPRLEENDKIEFVKED